jgi:hypothetical protein
MRILHRIKHFLCKPFPQEESIFATFKIITFISGFVVTFLFIFKPFGLHLIELGLFLLCLGFGSVAFITSFIYELLIVKVLKLKGAGSRFNFGTWILYFFGAMFCISLANFVFVRLVIFDDIQWVLFPYMLRGTFAVGVFPVLVVCALALIGQEKKYQSIAEKINQQDSISKKPSRGMLSKAQENF